MELDESRKKALKVFHQLKDESPSDYDTLRWEGWMLHRAHSMFRNDELSPQEFAFLMDEVVCW